MDNKIKLNTLLLITLFSLLLTVNHAKASTAAAQVYSVSSGSPVAYLDNYRVNTITKGVVNGKTVYKPMVQTVGKALMVSTFRKIIAVNAVGLGLMLAYDYFIDDETGVLTTSVTEGYGSCTQWLLNGNSVNINHGSMSVSACGSILGTGGLTGYYAQLDGSRWELYDIETGVKRGGQSLGYQPTSTTVETKKAVADDELANALESYISGIENGNDIFNNPDGTPNHEFFPNPEFEYYSETDLNLMDLYGNGLLQSTDPLSDNYVTPEELARIKALYDAANKTDEQIADELTADIDKPLTREQYAEEQLLKENRAEASADSMSGIDLSGLDKTTELDEQFNILDNMITNPADLPSVLPSLPQFNFTPGCQTVNLPMGVVFPNTNQCNMLNQGKEMLGYFLYILFAWMITTQLLKEAN